MPIKLNGSTSGYVQLDAPAVAGTTNITLPNSSVDLSASFGAWQTWNPTLYSITVGNGTLISKYTLIGKTCIFKFWFKLGSTSSLSASTAAFSLPFAINQTADYEIASFPAMYHRAGNSLFYGNGDVGTSSSNNNIVEFLISSTTGTYLGGPSLVNSTIPFTWAVNDKIHCSGIYEVA